MRLKKIILPAVLGIAAFSAFAMDLASVNEKIANLLKPYNNESSMADVKFLALESNDTRVTHLSAAGQVWMKNQFEASLSMPEFSYTYPTEESTPELKIKLDLKAQLVAIFGADYLDQMAVEAEDLVKSTAEDFVSDYGPAAIVDAKVTDLTKDADGHVSSLKLHIDLKIDMSKLPESKPVEKVEVQDLRIDLTVDQTSATLEGKVHPNKKYFLYQRDQKGLKEIVDGLLNDNKETYDDVMSYIEFVAWGLDYLTKAHN